ncbi:MAG: arginine repressor [Calditrichia bacterium]|nr:arginine repressor [Calditrichia bacterium]
MASKKERQFFIKQIIMAKHIPSQELLLKELELNGFKTTQATLSRDLHQMGIVRKPTMNGYRYYISEEEGGHPFSRVVSMEIIGIYQNELGVVIRTITGRATGVALFIDRLHDERILGTIAGDNCVYLIPDTVKNSDAIVSYLKNLIYES